MHVIKERTVRVIFKRYVQDTDLSKQIRKTKGVFVR